MNPGRRCRKPGTNRLCGLCYGTVTSLLKPLAFTESMHTFEASDSHQNALIVRLLQQTLLLKKSKLTSIFDMM
jgi:hypothetical protein